jgi:delta1-piperideine-2-carboxylate reductase
MSVADPTERIGFDALAAGLERRFLEAGAAPWVAQILARNCAACERDGTHSHGVFRMAGYLATIKSGWVDARAEPVMEQVGPSFLRVDARNGFAQPAMSRAHQTAVEMLRETGLVVVAMRESHHFSALWPDVEPWAEQGCVALTLVTGGTIVMPFGTKGRLLGTNPIGFAAPVEGQPPLVFDFATARMSQGDVRLAEMAGRLLPPDTGLDRHGHATDDPSAVLAGGGILPFGGHKGAALSLMVEVLASAFTGGAFAHEMDWSTHPGAETPRTGQFLLVADPGRGQGAGFARRMAGLMDMLREAGASRLPGQHRHQLRAAAERDGIPVTPEIRRLVT